MKTPLFSYIPILVMIFLAQFSPAVFASKSLNSQMPESLASAKSTEILLSDTQNTGFIPSEPRTAVVGAQKTLVILSYFQGQSEPDVFPGEDDQTRVNGVMATISDYYRENSYGNIWFEGAVNTTSPALGADVYGYYQLPINHTCNTVSIENYSRAAILAENPSIDFALYDHFVYIGPFANCGWGGYSDAHGKNWVSTLYEGVLPQGIGHELGHSLGYIAHAHFADCGEVSLSYPCNNREYGDFYSIMGSSSNKNIPRHMNAYEKDYLGWLDATRSMPVITQQTMTSDGIYTVTPIESATPGIKGLRIPRSTNDSIFVEFRQPIGFDTSMDDGASRTVFQGATLHSRYSIHTWLLDATTGPGNPGNNFSTALLPGGIFVDPDTATTVEVLNLTIGATPEQSTLTVRVTNPIDLTLPVVVVQSLPATISSDILVSVDATDDEGVGGVQFTHSVAGYVPLQTLTNPTNGNTYSFLVHTRDLPNGPITFALRAFNHSGLFTPTFVVSTFINNPPPRHTPVERD